MKATIHSAYGPPSLLRIEEVERPVPKDNEVLINMGAASVNRTDCAILTGTPLIMRLLTGLRKPKKRITGTDFAGEIMEAGKNVTLFKSGQKVFGFDDSGICSHAEYIVLSEKQNMIPMPNDWTYEQAVAFTEGAHYAVNFINKVKLKAGQKVLVNGATGAIGSALVQLLKYHQLSVTAVCRGEHFDLVRKLGAQKTIDYTETDFTKDNEEYDFVFDAVGKSSFRKCKPLLKPKGIYISSELGPGNENVYLPLLTSLKSGKKVKFPFPYNVKRSFRLIKKLVEQGDFVPVIDKIYPIDQAVEAFEYVISGQKVGNVVLKM